jgi:8-oxo-dGTP diphosphatase
MVMNSVAVLVAVGMKAFVFDQHQELLVLEKPASQGQEVVWDIPGGGILLGEQPADGVRREIKEESGLEVGDLQLLDTLTTMSPKRGFCMYMMYVTRAQSEAVVVSGEHVSYKWVGLDEAAEINLPDRYKRLLSRLD